MFKWIGEHWLGIVAVIGIFFEISPIKFNPITWILGKIGKRLTLGLQKDISELKKVTDELSDRVDANEKDRIRYEVFAFASSVRRGEEHTKDEFVHIISINDKYSALLKRTNDKNGVFETEYKYIIQAYNKQFNKFLVGE